MKIKVLNRIFSNIKIDILEEIKTIECEGYEKIVRLSASDIELMIEELKFLMDKLK